MVVSHEYGCELDRTHAKDGPEAARARVATDRKRLREILAERQRKQRPAPSSSHSQ